MTDLKRRIKTVETRLGIGAKDEVIIVRPPKYASETAAEYQERINRPFDESKCLPVEVRTYNDVTIRMPRRYKPEFADLEN